MYKGLEDLDLTNKQKTFVVEYATDMNGVRACKEAGYKGSDKVLSVRATKLLRNTEVKRAISIVGQARMERANLDSERVLKQLENFLFLDPAELFDNEGYLKCDLDKLPRPVRQAINSFEVDEIYDRQGNLMSKRIKVRPVDKLRCLEMAMKYNKLYEDKTEVNVQMNFWDKFWNHTQPQQTDTELKIKELGLDAES